MKLLNHTIFAFILSMIIIPKEIFPEDALLVKTIKSKDGKIKAEYQYKKGGIFHGYYNVYYPNGNMKIKGQYKNRVRIGTWIYYNMNGTINKKEFFNEEGKQISKKLFGTHATYTEVFSVDKPLKEIKETVKKVYLLQDPQFNTKYFSLPKDSSVEKEKPKSAKEKEDDEINRAVNIIVSQKTNMRVRNILSYSLYKEFKNTFKTSESLQAEKVDAADALVRIKVMEYGLTTERSGSNNYMFPFASIEVALLGEPPFAVRREKGTMQIVNQEKHPIIWSKLVRINKNDAKDLAIVEYKKESLVEEGTQLYNKLTDDTKLLSKTYQAVSRILAANFIDYFENSSE